jgi:hypothetical protein
MSVSIGSTSNPVGTPKPLFGQRFLVDVFASNAQPTLEVILNWAGTEANRPVR